MISIRRQLTRRLLGATLGLLAFSVTALVAVACYAVVRQFDIALRTKALAVSTAAHVTADSVRLDFSDHFLDGFDDVKPRDYFQLWLTDGTTLARSESLGRAELPHRLGSFSAPSYFLCTLPNGRPGRAIGYVFQPKPAPGVTRQANVELVVATDRENLDGTLLQLFGLAATCGLLLLGTTLWAVPRILRRGLQSLDRLGEQAAGINANSLTVRFPVGELPEELQPIADRLNSLLARLSQSFERERRFSADLAHELRTPIAELRSLAECALKWPESREAAIDSEVLAIALQMESLTIRMLALSRGQLGQLANAPELVDLAPLVEELWEPFAPRATARRLRVKLTLAPAQVTADPVLLRSILTNLFDNAVDYTPENGEIEISLAHRENSVSLWVANPAAGLNPTDLGKLFDPFWRKDAARTGGQHMGLGLSLAHTFAAAMGWTLSAMLDGQSRLVFSLINKAP